MLEAAVTDKKSTGDVTITQETHEAEAVYLITEKNNATQLAVPAAAYPAFLKYFQEHYSTPVATDTAAAGSSNYNRSKQPNARPWHIIKQ